MNSLLFFCILPLFFRLTEAVSCPNAWVTWQDNCYLFSKDEGTWHDTEQECISQGAHLASIHSAFEDNFIADTAYHAFTGIGSLWVGGGNVDTGTGLYAWTDKTPFDYQAWSFNQPSANGKNGVAVTFSLGLFKGKWASKNPNDKHSFVCKKSPT